MPSVTIYLSQEVMDDVVGIAEERGISVSKVLASSFRSPIKKEVGEYVDAFVKFEKRLDSIESKLDGLIKVYRIERSESPVREAEKISREKITPQEEEILRKAMTKIPNAIKDISDIPDRYKPPEFVGGVPKAKWKGAK